MSKRKKKKKIGEHFYLILLLGRGEYTLYFALCISSEGFTHDIAFLNQLLESVPQFALVGGVHYPVLGRKAKPIGRRMHKAWPCVPVHLT